MTYRELWERSGAELAGIGVRKSDLVVINLPRFADLVVIFLGIIRTAVPSLPLELTDILRVLSMHRLINHLNELASQGS